MARRQAARDAAVRQSPPFPNNNGHSSPGWSVVGRSSRNSLLSAGKLRLRVKTGVVRRRPVIWSILDAAKVKINVRCVKRHQFSPGFSFLVDRERILKTYRKLKHQCLMRGMQAKIEYLDVRQRNLTIWRPKLLRPEEVLLCSWNTNGWKSKRVEISNYLSQFKPAFFCGQETRLNANCFAPRLDGYSMISSCAKGLGVRGVCVGIKFGIRAFEAKGIDGYLVAVKAFGLHPDNAGISCTIASIYRGKGFKWMNLLQWMAGCSKDPVVIAGDFNCDFVRLSNVLKKAKGNRWFVLKLGDDGPTHLRGSWAIDHVVVNLEGRRWLTGGLIDRSIDISDHFPLVVKVQNINRPILKPRVVIDRSRLLKVVPEFLRNNTFAPLLAIDDVDEVCKSFVEISNKHLKDEGFVKENTGNHYKRHIPFLLKKRIANRRKLFKKTRFATSDEDIIREYLKERNEVRKEIKKYHLDCWLDWIEIGCKYYTSHNPRGTWNWINKTSEPLKVKSIVGGPILSKDLSHLLFEPNEIQNRWQSHFASLANETDPEVLDLSFWQEKYKHLKQNTFIKSISLDLTWSDIVEAVDKMPNWKAAGADNLPPEFFKSIILENITPRSNGAKLLFHLLKLIFSNGIPLCWQGAVIVPIPKKGDFENPDDYRGISLIAIGVKIVCKIVERRLSIVSDCLGAVRREQFGFRKREEATAARVLIQELSKRRQYLGLNTFITFLDLQKAYDSVPTFALLAKIQKLGINGKMFDFLRHLYLTSSSSVRVDGVIGPSFPCKRGVRQGCPLSPLLFNLFINDIFDNLEGGVTLGPHSVRGCMFADDLLLIDESKEKHQENLDKVFQWATLNGLRFGISKCGHLANHPAAGEMRLGADLLPAVDDYVYLGCRFQKDLGFDLLLKDRIAKVEKLGIQLNAFISCHSIPLIHRLNLFKSKIMGAIGYGAELLGSSGNRHVGILQSSLNKILRRMVGSKSKNKALALGPLFEEFGLISLRERYILGMLRAEVKWRQSETFVSDIFEYPSSKGVLVWTTMAKRLKEKVPKFDIEKKRIQNIVFVRQKFSFPFADSTAFKTYQRLGFKFSNEYLKKSVLFPKDALGVKWLTRARFQAIWFAARAANVRLIPMSFANQCFACGSEVSAKEQLAHSLECKSFAGIRARTGLNVVIEQLRGQSVGGTGSQILFQWECLLGKTQDEKTIIPNWVNSKTNVASTDLSVEGGNETPVFIIFARFLSEVMPVLMHLLWDRDLWDESSTAFQAVSTETAPDDLIADVRLDMACHLNGTCEL
jgi:exonuclease III